MCVCVCVCVCGTRIARVNLCAFVWKASSDSMCVLMLQTWGSVCDDVPSSSAKHKPLMERGVEGKMDKERGREGEEVNTHTHSHTHSHTHTHIEETACRFPLMAWFILQAMQRACSYLVGEHDFRNFCKVHILPPPLFPFPFPLPAALRPSSFLLHEDGSHSRSAQHVIVVATAG